MGPWSMSSITQAGRRVVGRRGAHASPALHARRPWPFNADTGWPRIHRSQRARCSAGRSGSVSPALGLLLPRRFRRFLLRPAFRCLSRSQRRSSPRLRRPWCRAGNRKARWLGPAVRRARGARKRCGHAGLRRWRRGSTSDAAWEHPEAWVQAQTVAAVTARDCRPAPEPPRRNGINGCPLRKPARQAKPARTPGAPAGAVAGRVHPLPVRHHRPARPHLRRLVGVGRYGGRRNEVNTCKPTAPRCSDGSLQVAAWYSSDYVDLPLPSGSSAIQYWYPDAVVRLTPAETARLQWALNNVPVTRVETLPRCTATGPPT